MKQLILLPFFILLFGFNSQATHLKGGFIQYEHLDGRTYSITLTVYTSSESPVAFGQNGVLNFGDGSSIELGADGNMDKLTKTSLKNNIYKNVLSFEHTYTSNGSYVIFYAEPNRDEGILNLEGSVNIPFYIESFLLLDPQIRNNSVRISENPAFAAFQNQTYHYNSYAADQDGDSLSFHLVTPRQSSNTVAAGYTYPHLTFDGAKGSETGENTYYAINPRTGDLIWDSPLMTGTYALALEIREWREIEGEMKMVGKVLQDYIVMVEEPGNDLQLIFPVQSQEVFLEKDTPWETTIRAVANNPEDTVVLMLSGDFLKEFPAITPADSVGGIGEVSITIQFSPSEISNTTYQLIANAYLFSNVAEPSSRRSRAVYLLTPGFVNGLDDLPIRSIKVYPNPSFSNSFFLDYPLLNGKEIVVSMFAQDGQLTYHTTIPSFSSHQLIHLPQRLSGFYFVVIRQGVQVYTARILFSQK